MARIVCLGEAMVELSARGDDWRVGHGGDTLNTAVHLARTGHDVAYMTALGHDAFSKRLRAAWAAEGLDCSLALDHPERQVGLYAIATDDRGERSFSYWRDTSAARALFEIDGIDRAMATAERADLLCFSLISLAILDEEDRSALIGLAMRVRARGGRVAFDGNYRPRLWRSSTEARAWRDRAISVADIGLPTLEDEQALGAIGADVVAAHWQGLGCGEVVVKLGAEGARLPDGSLCPVPRRLDPVDTSGAGDAFNGGYLAARMRGAAVRSAAEAGHALASWTVMRPGAIPARDAAAPY